MPTATLFTSANSTDLLEVIQESWRNVVAMLWKKTQPSWPSWGEPLTTDVMRRAIEELAMLTVTPPEQVVVHALTALVMLHPGPLADFEADEAGDTAWKLFFLLVAAVSENRPAYRDYCARLLATYVGDKERDPDWWLKRAEMYAALELPHFARLY